MITLLLSYHHWICSKSISISRAICYGKGCYVNNLAFLINRFAPKIGIGLWSVFSLWSRCDFSKFFVRVMVELPGNINTSLFMILFLTACNLFLSSPVTHNIFTMLSFLKVLQFRKLARHWNSNLIYYAMNESFIDRNHHCSLDYLTPCKIIHQVFCHIVSLKLQHGITSFPFGSPGGGQISCCVRMNCTAIFHRSRTCTFLERNCWCILWNGKFLQFGES